MQLEELGWNDFFQGQFETIGKELVRARVRRQDAGGYQLFAEAGDMQAVLTGKFRHQANSKADLPTVGDWVLVETLPNEPGKGIIRYLLARRSKFSRKEAGHQVDEQIIAANIDTVFVVCGLDGDLNLRRIERYLTTTWDSGAVPVIILNKSDLCSDVESKIDEVSKVSLGVEIIPVSAIDGTGMDELKAHLEPGKTAAMLGSSGVGKSTIINLLLGYERFETHDVRESDGRGRHTTTFRELTVTSALGLIIDTPGMREIQMWTEEDALERSFNDLQAFAQDCRFSDCSHASEPGCAVQRAIQSGELEEERLLSFRKLQREMRRNAQQQDLKARLDRKARVRRFSKFIRKRPTKRDYQRPGD